MLLKLMLMLRITLWQEKKCYKMPSLFFPNEATPLIGIFL